MSLSGSALKKGKSPHAVLSDLRKGSRMKSMVLYHKAKMFACKYILTKSSISKAHEVCMEQRSKTCHARLSVHIRENYKLY